MPTQRQKKLVKVLLENKGKSVSKAMLEVGYPPGTAKNPQQVTESLGFKELMEKVLPNDKLIKKHDNLLNAHKLEHMTFPLGPATEEDEDFEEDEEVGDLMSKLTMKERTKLTDDEIKTMLLGVNCIVKQIVHGEQARHVYFWAPDNKSQKDALDMAYKLTGVYAPEKKQSINLNITPGDPTDMDKLRLKYEEELKTKLMP